MSKGLAVVIVERWGRLETGRSLWADPSSCLAGARLGVCVRGWVHSLAGVLRVWKPMELGSQTWL